MKHARNMTLVACLSAVAAAEAPEVKADLEVS